MATHVALLVERYEPDAHEEQFVEIPEQVRQFASHATHDEPARAYPEIHD